MAKHPFSFLSASLVLTVAIIYFSFDAAAVDNRGSQSLDSIVQQLDSLSDYTIYLSGYTDSVGSENENGQLAEKRALAVRGYLISKNIDSTKIKIGFYGEQKPEAPNTSDTNRALNGRVELEIVVPKTERKPAGTIVLSPQNTDSTKTDDVIVPAEVKKQKRLPRLVWTGWKTGFHWSTPGKAGKK